MQKSTFSILFFIKKSEPKKNGLSTIMIRITIDGKQIQFSSKLEITASAWTQKQNKAVGRTKEVKQINAALNSIRLDLHKYYFDFAQAGHNAVLFRIKQAFCGLKDQASILYLFDQYIKDIEKKVGLDITAVTLYKYQSTRTKLEDFMLFEYKTTLFNVYSISTRFIENFYIFLRKESNCNNNTSMKYIQRFSCILKRAQEEGLIIKNPIKDFRIKFDEYSPVFLTADEINKIRCKNFVSQRLSRIRDAFVFSCFTGISFSDINKLKRSDIHIGVNNQNWIRINRTKTNVLAHVPIIPPCLEIIKESINKHPNTLLFDMCTNQKTNEYLKEIAEICGINKRLTYHVSRHSFATLMLNYGVSIESLSRMMGHKNIKATQLYAQITDRKIISEVEKADFSLFSLHN